MNATRIIAYAQNGARCSLQQMLPYGVGGGAKNMTQAQFDAYKLARLNADTRNNGSLEKAKNILADAGFTVYYE